MSTHGDIQFVDELNDGRSIWLHAYSDGHSNEAYDMLVNLPEWLAERAELSLKLKDPSIGPGWWIDMIVRELKPNATEKDIEAAVNSFRRHGELQDESWATTLSGHMVCRYARRWVPCPEEAAPWHEVGDPADFVVTCDGDSYHIQPSPDILSSNEEFADEPGFIPIIPVTVDFTDRLAAALVKAVAKELTNHVPNQP